MSRLPPASSPTPFRSRRATLYHTDHHSIPLPAGHKFPIGKYALLCETLETERICAFAPAPLADPADIELAHDPAYVRAFLAARSKPPALRGIGFPWSDHLDRK